MSEMTQKLLLAAVILVLVVLAISTLAGGMMGGGHMFNQEAIGNRSWMWGLGMGFGGLLMLIFWGAVIAGIVFLVREVGRKEAPSGKATPVEILKRRYAAGEIAREQYEQMKRDLES
jgi:putative membrane protein